MKLIKAIINPNDSELVKKAHWKRKDSTDGPYRGKRTGAQKGISLEYRGGGPYDGSISLPKKDDPDRGRYPRS